MTRHWRDLLTDFVLEVLCVEKVNEASNVFWSTDITEVTRMNQHITRWQLQTSCEAVGVRNAHKPKKKVRVTQMAGGVLSKLLVLKGFDSHGFDKGLLHARRVLLSKTNEGFRQVSPFKKMSGLSFPFPFPS